MTDNRFIEAARLGLNDFWRYAATIFLTVSLFVIAGVCAVIALLVQAGEIPSDLTQLSGPGFLLANLFPFAFILLGLWIGARLLHKRPFLSIINPSIRFDWRRFALGGGLWLLLTAISDLALSVIQPGNYVFNLDLPALLPVLAIAVVFLPIQIAGEELMFRGYLTQGIGHRFGFWAGWIVPAILFGLLHGANPEVLQYGALLSMPIYIGMGLLLGWITLRSESMELALGLHLANNLYAALLVTFPSSALATPALFTIQRLDPAVSLVVFFVIAPIYLLLLHWLARGFFRKGLFSKP